MIQVKAVNEWREIEIPGEAVLVLKLITDGRSGPRALLVVALVIEPSAIKVGHGTGLEVRRSTWVGKIIYVPAQVPVFETGKAMLPTRRRGDHQFYASQKIILPLPAIAVRRFQASAIEIPRSSNPGSIVGMTSANAQGNFVAQRETKVCPLKRIGIIVVQALSVGVELLREPVVVN